MPYLFLWRIVCLEVAFISHLSVIVLAVHLHSCKCARVCVFVCSELHFSITICYHFTLDDKYQTNFAFCFKLCSFNFRSFSSCIVNMQVCVCVGVCTYFLINFRFNCIRLCVCVCSCVFIRLFLWLRNRKFPQLVIYCNNSNSWGSMICMGRNWIEQKILQFTQTSIADALEKCLPWNTKQYLQRFLIRKLTKQFDNLPD